MTLSKKIIDKLISDRSFYFMFLPTAFFVFAVAFLLLLYPQAAFDGVREGIDTCLSTVIPSLFPFLFISDVSYELGIFALLSSKTEKLMYSLFRLPSAAFPIIVMSLIGGFPVGATLVGKALDSNSVTRTQAQRMLLFCINPGPAFVVLTVGCLLLSSAQIGWIIYASITFSSLLTGVLSRFLFENENFVAKAKPLKISTEPGRLAKTLNHSTKNMVNICAWIVIFSCMGKLAENLPLGRGVLICFRLVSEVTGGAITAAEHFALPVVAAVISFSGICVHFQIMPFLIKAKLKYKYFLSVRILCAALSCVITYILLELFPQYSDAVSLIQKSENVSLGASPAASVFFMFMSGLLIIGDNYIVGRKSIKNTDHNK